MNTIIDNLDRLSVSIIDIFRTKVYYTVQNNQLIQDSKEFIPILTNYRKEPEMFSEVLSRILNTWRPILANNIITLITNYKNLVIAFKNSLIEKQRELILFSNSLDQEKRVVENELNDITETLSNMFSTGGELNSALRKIKLSKQTFKKPSRRKDPRRI